MAQVEIKVRHNGPYKVTGPIRLIDADGNEYDVRRASRPCSSLRRLELLLADEPEPKPE